MYVCMRVKCIRVYVGQRKQRLVSPPRFYLSARARGSSRSRFREPLGALSRVCTANHDWRTKSSAGFDSAGSARVVLSRMILPESETDRSSRGDRSSESGTEICSLSYVRRAAFIWYYSGRMRICDCAVCMRESPRTHSRDERAKGPLARSRTIISPRCFSASSNDTRAE